MTEWIYELLEIGLSERLKTARQTLRNYSYTVVKHLIKLLIWKDSTGSKEYWINEIIDDYFNVFRKIETDNKFGRLKKQDYIQYLFKPYTNSYKQFEGIVDDIVESLQEPSRKVGNKKVYPKPSEYTVETLWNKIQEFITKCSQLLENKSTNRQQLKEILGTLAE